MNIRNNFDIILIGENTLLIFIIEKIIQNDSFNIKAIISDNLDIHKYASYNEIFCIEYSSYKSNPISCDYLFSIVNHHIIPSNIIKNYVNKLAINYHDSLLPKYAGLNSTTWAILNNETTHGITWHAINDRIDGGGIYLQKQVAIKPQDTAKSLNIKCSNIAIKSFDELVNKILRIGIKPTIQNLVNQKYYGKNSLPDNIGIIDDSMSFEQVSTLSRSLDFGEHNINGVATLKIEINGDFYIISSFRLRKVELAESTNVRATKKYILCKFKNIILKIYKLQSIYGNELNLNDIAIRSIAKKTINLDSQDSVYNIAHANEHRTLTNNGNNYLSKEAEIIEDLSSINIKDKKLQIYREFNKLLVLKYSLAADTYNGINDEENYEIFFKDADFRLRKYSKKIIRILIAPNFYEYSNDAQKISKKAFDYIVISNNYQLNK